MADSCPACSARKAHHSDKLKSDIEKRLNRIEGQIKAVRRLISDDVYCDEVLNQITSVQAALGGVSMLLLEQHVKSCIVEQVQEGKTEVIDELMKTIQRMTK